METTETTETIETKFANVAWTANDVLAVHPHFTHEQAVNWLIENERVIADIMVERGWQAIEDLMWEQGLKTESLTS